MSQRPSTSKQNRLPEVPLPNMTMHIDRIVEARGRGISAQYYVRLIGDSPDFVWLKAQQIEREVIVDFNRRKNREKRAEARRLKNSRQNKAFNSIDKYFKPQLASSMRDMPSRLSSSQPNHLSQYLMEEDMNEEQVSSPTPELDDLEPTFPHAAILNSNDDLPTVDWLMNEPNANPHAPGSSKQGRVTIDEQQWPELEGRSPARLIQTTTDHRDLVACNVCQKVKVKAEETLLSICGHMHMCFDCAAGILVNMLRNDCLICNQMDSFALNMFEVIKHLTCQLMASNTNTSASNDSERRDTPETPPRSPRLAAAASPPSFQNN